MLERPPSPPPALPSVATAKVSDWCASAHMLGLHLYAVIDELHEGIHRWGKAIVHDERNLFAERSHEPQALAIAPRLRLIRPDRLARAANLLHEQSPEQPDAFLIASSLQLDELAQRLMRRFDVSSAGMEMLLRIWDARVFRALPAALTPSSARTLLSFGMQALVSDRGGAHCSIDLHEEKDDPLQTMPLSLSQTEENALVALAQPDAVLAMVRENAPELLRQLPDGERHAMAEAQMNECLSRGLESPRDHALALSLAIVHGPQWWLEPHWQTCIRQARESTLFDAYRMNMMEET